MRIPLRLAFALTVVFAPTALFAAPFDDCKVHLPFGVPELTKQAPTSAVCHAGYAVLHDDKFLVPRWVAYRLTGPHTLGCLARTNNFHADENLPDGKRALPADYKGSGFDQGHQAPAQDFAWDAKQLSDSFSMANMAPQLGGLNRKEWERLEETVRVWATDRKELIVYVGPILLNTKHTIGADHVVVPTAFWKVVVDPSNGEALAFIMPQQDIAKGPLEPFQVTVSKVEEAAQIKLPLPTGTDRAAEAKLWPANLSAWAKEHKKLCPAASKKKTKRSSRKHG